METSKAYFEDILRRFDTERRGRTLFQFCRDEGADYKTVKIYHRDYCGIEIYTKWFENGRMLKPEFRTIARTHTVTRSQLTLLLVGAVQATLSIE